MGRKNFGARVPSSKPAKTPAARVARSEAEVFADLEALYQSPGYPRVIARMCLLDTMIS
jgi:hypothetical protein